MLLVQPKGTYGHYLAIAFDRPDDESKPVELSKVLWLRFDHSLLVGIHLSRRGVFLLFLDLSFCSCHVDEDMLGIAC